MNGDEIRLLIIVRVGKKSIHRSWLWTIRHMSDVALSIYDDSDIGRDCAKFLHVCKGGKFPGISDFFKENPELINQYDYFFLMEDDIFLPAESLLTIKKLLSRFKFSLSAPSLTESSFFTWPIAIRNNKFLFRCTDFVEVMVPIMSRDFLLRAMKAFDDNYSGWGHEWYWRKILNETGNLAAIFDQASVCHTRPFGSGPLLQERPVNYIDPKIDMDNMVVKYNLDTETPFKNYFGVTSDRKPRIVIDTDFINLALSGYSHVQSFDREQFARCIDVLIKENACDKGNRDFEKTETYKKVLQSIDHGNKDESNNRVRN